MVSRSFPFVAVLVFAMLARASASAPTFALNRIVFEFFQYEDDVVVLVNSELESPLTSVSESAACPAPAATLTSAGDFSVCLNNGQSIGKYPLTLSSSDGPFTLGNFEAAGDGFLGGFMAFDVNLDTGVANLYAPEGQTLLQSTANFPGQNLADWIPDGSGFLATFTVDGHPGVTVEILFPESDRVLGDPHFFVGRSLYDWKQVGVYDHLVFADHAVTLEVEEFAGCDGEMSGEFILGLSVSGTSWTAACDGIYDANTGELVAKHRFTLTTPCVTATVLLTNGYLNLHNITTSCKVEGGVHKAMTDHASSNVDGWWEWTEAGGFELKDKAVPKMTPLVKKPRVISIDI